MKMKEIASCYISPSHSSLVPPVTLPLTFLDIPWLLFPPSQTIFFYSFPISTATFIAQTLPKLNHALSLTLNHFFPLAGRLISPEDPYIQYADGDCIEMTIAESILSVKDFVSLTARTPKLATDLHSYVPILNEATEQHLLAVKITVFPGLGICFGFTMRHVVADGRTFNNFLKMWTSIFRNDDLSLIQFVHDRSMFENPNGEKLKSTFVEQWLELSSKSFGSVPKFHQAPQNEIIRATFVLLPEEIERVKKRILSLSCAQFGSSRTRSLFMSTYVVVCSLIWNCWIKTHFSSLHNTDKKQKAPADGEQVHSLGFIAGGITRFRFNVPNTYVGNFVGFGRASCTRSKLLSELNGVLFAAEAIGETIQKLNKNILSDAENWISEWKILRESPIHLTVVGSPKIGMYGLDFGWGRPSKIEQVSIDGSNSISLFESRDNEGGIELGVVLPRPQMEALSSLFAATLC